MAPSSKKPQPLLRRPVFWAAIVGVLAAAAVGYVLYPKVTPEKPPAFSMMPDRWFDRPDRADWTGWDAKQALAGPRLRLAVAAAQVRVIPEDRADIAVEVQRPDAAAPIKVTRQGADAIVESATPPAKPLACRDGGVVVGDVVKRPEALPLILVRTPRQVSIHATGALFGAVEPAQSLQIVNHGCGAWAAADVAEGLRFAQSGPGALRAGQARTLLARIEGPGVVEAERAIQALDVYIVGDGRVHVKRADGRLNAELWENGRLQIDKGRASIANLFKHGAGEIVHTGEAATMNAQSYGKGSIRVAVVSGTVGVGQEGDGRVVYERAKGKTYCRGNECL